MQATAKAQDFRCSFMAIPLLKGGISQRSWEEHLDLSFIPPTFPFWRSWMMATNLSAKPISSNAKPRSRHPLISRRSIARLFSSLTPSTRTAFWVSTKQPICWMTGTEQAWGSSSGIETFKWSLAEEEEEYDEGRLSRLVVNQRES